MSSLLSKNLLRIYELRGTATQYHSFRSLLLEKFQLVSSCKKSILILLDYVVFLITIFTSHEDDHQNVMSTFFLSVLFRSMIVASSKWILWNRPPIKDWLKILFLCSHHHRKVLGLALGYLILLPIFLKKVG